MNLIFLGSGAFGLPTLQALAREHTLLAVITQPDRPAGRGGHLTPTPIGEYAQNELPLVLLLKPPNVNAPEVMAQVKALEADAAVVIAFGQKLSQEVLPGPLRAINLHASLLPRWRGAAPINAAILAGDEVTGNSVITIADRMDAGLVLGQSQRRIDPLTTAGDLHDILAADGPALVQQILEQIQGNTLVPQVQDEALITKAPKLSKKDSWVDFSQPAEQARRRIHGLTPWPGVAVQFRGEPLKLLRVRAALGSPVGFGPEQVASILEPESGVIACGDGTTLTLLKVQPANGTRMTWEQFAHGRRPTRGEVLTGGAPTC